jgi:hypothetical protein
MAFELIPFPISIIFVLVFGVAAIAVLRKLRKRGKFYLILFYTSLIIGVAVFALLSYSIALSMLQGPQSSNQPILIPQPSMPQNVTQIIYLFF